MAGCEVRLDGPAAEQLARDSEDMYMRPDEYLRLALTVLSQLPPSLRFALSAGVPVSFYATANVGCGGGVDG